MSGSEIGHGISQPSRSAALKSISRIAQAHAAPDVRLAAMPPHPRQRERPVVGREIGLLLGVEKELRRTFAARLALPASHGCTCVQYFARSNSIAGIEEQDLDALAGQVPGRHASGCSAADDDHGIDPARRDDLHSARYYAPKSPKLTLNRAASSRQRPA